MPLEATLRASALDITTADLGEVRIVNVSKDPKPGDEIGDYLCTFRNPQDWRRPRRVTVRRFDRSRGAWALLGEAIKGLEK